MDLEIGKEQENLLIESGLDWTVRTEGCKTTESGIILPKKIAIIRNDTNTVLGDHKDGYMPYQNHELLELLFKISTQTGLSLHSGGYFKNGEKVFIQLKSDDLRLGNDKVEGYISGLNSFDGSTSLSFGTSNHTVSCSNSFFLVYRTLQSKMRHSANMIIKIEEVLQNIDKLVVEEKENFSTIKRLADVRMTDDVKEMVTRYLFDLKKEDRLDDPDLSTNKKNKILRFDNDLATELGTKEDTLWGLFSGVTRYTTHSMKKGDNTEGKIFGRTGLKERAIWNMLAETV